ncbi:MAG TPA: ASCH domain-containing protein [Bacilli bacterium]|nr:ASCH domain-containing protein [Bacilli bacterium]
MKNEVKPTIHEMKIKPEYFELVARGGKIYEVRTNDSRRKAMKVGDYIKMLKEPEQEEYLMLLILNKVEFKNFTELYDTLPKKSVGFNGRTTEEIVNELRRFYTKEQENELGTVAIEIEVIKELSYCRELQPSTTLVKK